MYLNSVFLLAPILTCYILLKIDLVKFPGFQNTIIF